MDLNSQHFVQDFRILKKSLGLSWMIIHRTKDVIRDADEKGLVRRSAQKSSSCNSVYIA
jgi:hypothetical protein